MRTFFEHVRETKEVQQNMSSKYEFMFFFYFYFSSFFFVSFAPQNTSCMSAELKRNNQEGRVRNARGEERRITVHGIIITIDSDYTNDN